MMLFLQLATVLVACRAVGLLFRRLGQTQVVADMVAGFLLGPTLLGFVFPAIQDHLFPTAVQPPGGGESITHPSLHVLYVIGQLGLVLYMFLVGLAFDNGLLVRHLKESATASVAGIIAPVAVGGLIGWQLASGDTFFPDSVAPWQAALFVAAALAITAFPMLARIVYEEKLTRTKLGTVAVACAAADDAAAWILLAVVVAAAKGDPQVAVIAVVGSLVYGVFMTTAGRRLLTRLGRWATTTRNGPPESGLRPEALGLVTVVLLLCAWFTEWTGVYSVFGAFILGAVMPRGVFAEELRRRIEPVTVHILLPVFFVYSGLNTDLNVLVDPTVLMVFAVVLVASFAAKGGACTLAWRATGSSWRDAAALGSLMNARGLMELILLNVGRAEGLITVELYTVLALMTVVTTMSASPLYRRIRRGAPPTTPPEDPSAPKALPEPAIPR
ncbi:cation:proton antiporter [Streptomyces sp. NPDC047886]